MKRAFISLTSDFGLQTQGIGNMHGAALEINPEANVIDLMHGIPDFDICTGARSLEATQNLPIGFHICVVDPGVGTKRKGIIIQTKRGDFLVGPDNGVLIPATRVLGGCEKVVEITNPKYMRQPVSPIFHGRDVFTPAAAHLSVGVKINEFGKELRFEELVKAPYEEAVVDGDSISAEVIHANKFGSIHLNILHKVWDQFNVEKNQTMVLEFNEKTIELPFVITFGEVEQGKQLIMKDDYGRIEAALNMGNFSEKYGIKVGDKCVVRKN
ncbi:MAG: SAM-dependent chlorinase/fluorinase [Candidatus Woesearchaeota archaeon]|jgi:S-adenosylmethionine hydrolase|nr:SAM-dependent chlorinase/fluorinase [Candidatus Woesearchaeota archaeon]MDP7458586.1 SAM-dependent chlorinase/fluorinase [Candidatus Woesearchaeota archaeon]